TCGVPFEDGPRAIVVSATDRAGNIGSAEVRFNVLTTPAVRIIEPENLEFLNISPITVRGTAAASAATVHVNGVAATLAGGTFAVTVPIVEGNNTLTAVARSASGKVGTNSVQVTLDTTPPRVAIRTPASGFETSDAYVAVSGTVNDIVVGTVNDQQAQVTVNGVPAVVANRSFIATDVPLSMGLNPIQVVALDRVGNSFTARVEVTRVAPAASSIRIAAGNHQSGAIGTALPTPLAVVVTSGGVPAANVPVVFRVTEGNGVITSGAQSAPWLVINSDATGRAEVRYRLGTRAGAGNNKVVATATGFAGTAIFSASASSGTPAMISIDAGLSQTGAIGSALAFPFVAVVTDAGHNRLEGVPVTFNVTRGGGKLQNGEATMVTHTDSDGRALALLTLGMEAGFDNQVVQATFPGNAGNPAAFSATAKMPGPESATRISGVVLDNSNNPLAGATMRLYQFYLGSASNIPVAVATPVVTNEQGQFTITNAPVGAFKLVADGTTIPGDERYPTLEFDVVTVAGQETTVGLPIYLPVLDRVNRLCVSETTGGTLTLPGVPGFSFTVAPGSATFPGGSRTGCVTVTPVHGDKVPMVPGFGQQPRFVITVQPVGTHFNPPAQISFPNVDGLQPREVTEMYSYDHDLSTFVAIGTGTVSDDGSILRSDPGVGVIKAGWHCGGNPNPTGSAATCPDCKKCQGTDCVPDPSRTGTLDDEWCCFNGEKIPKYGNSLEVLESKCPQRTQTDRRNHEVDG
ncbi:MAG TPA: hypothetical protein VHK90_13735, partial [Thermoanaerobaculia bacterium]|nr:hypothetical protein [Thermoanaerobaculia bacterium]